MAINWCDGTVTRNHVWTDGLFTLHVDVSGVLPFLAGQFLQVGLELDGETVYRPYSIASPPGPTLEFYIVRVDDGKLTPHLARLEPGAPIKISEPGSSLAIPGGSISSGRPGA